MIIKGRRRGGAKALSDHLRRTDENEQVKFHDLEGLLFEPANGSNLEKALKQMEAIGYGKNDKRNLYHAIIAPAYGETLDAKQRDFMVGYYAEHMGFKGHQYAVVEHWKKGKQHFHLVFNIINPDTGKTHELKWTKRKEWAISRGLEEILGLSTTQPKGKSSPAWAMQRGQRTGIDPRKIRKEVTAIFHSSKTTKEFIAALDKAGYALTKGNRNQFVLVDRFGDTHGLMRMIEDKKLADLKGKFEGIDTIPLPSHETLVKTRKPKKVGEGAARTAINPKTIIADVQRAFRTSKTGAQFFAQINKKGYSIGRGLHSFTIIDSNGGKHDLNRLLGKETVKGFIRKFPDLSAIKPSPVIEFVRRMKTGKPSRVARHPLRRMRFRFSMAKREFTCPHYQPSFHYGIGSLTSLILRLANVARIRAKKEEEKQYHFFPIMRRRARKKYQNEPVKLKPRRAEMENAELLQWAWENKRYDILAGFGIYILPENASLLELVQHGYIPLDALEP